MRADWNRLTERLRRGTMNRRDFLAAAAALGVSAATTQEALAQQPKRGGHLVIGLDQAATSDSFDPGTWNSSYMSLMGEQVLEGLTNVNEKFEVVPNLATSWAPKSGLAEWVIKLRRGVTFHNGKTMTAADVVYSLNHHRGANSKSMASSLVATIADIAATAPDEVTIKLDGGNADLPYMLADWHLMIVPEGSAFDGVGTGAFVLESFEPGVRALVKRNANDWNAARGYVASVETLAINDPTARLSALLSGSVHLINRITPTSVAALEKSPQAQIFTVAGGIHPTFSPSVNAPPYDNLDLRLALRYAIDREAWLKTVLRGYGKLGNDQPVPAHDPMYAADIPQRKYDPDKAKFHLKKSGYTGPVVLTVADTAFGGAVEAAQIFQAASAKAGINLQIDRVPNDGYYSKYWKKAPFFASNYGGRYTADIMLTTEFGSNSGLNETRWSNPKFDQLLIAARAELDKAKRKQMYRDLQQMVHDEAGTIIAVFNNTIDGGSRKLRGFVASPVQQMSGYHAPQMVWFADA